MALRRLAQVAGNGPAAAPRRCPFMYDSPLRSAALPIIEYPLRRASRQGCSTLALAPTPSPSPPPPQSLPASSFRRFPLSHRLACRVNHPERPTGLLERNGLVHSLIPGDQHHTIELPTDCSKWWGPSWTPASCALAAVVLTLCTKPVTESTPDVQLHPEDGEPLVPLLRDEVAFPGRLVPRPGSQREHDGGQRA